MVADLVEEALDGGTPRPPQPAEADRGALLDLLRSELLAEWPEDRPGLLETLRAFETVRGSLAPDGATGALSPGVLTPYGHRLLREVAHTLRSPLGSIVILAETLQDGLAGSLDDRQREQLRIVHRAALSVAALAGDLLSLTREEDEVHDEPVSFEVPRLLDQVADLVRPVTAQRGVNLHVLPGDLSALVGHPGPLRRILLNLSLQTAVRSRTGDVTMAASREDGSAVFRVEGPAEGLAPDEVFEAFRRAEEGGGYSVSAGGLGIGVARHLVRRLGSELISEAVGDDNLRLSFRLSWRDA